MSYGGVNVDRDIAIQRLRPLAYLSLGDIQKRAGGEGKHQRVDHR